jgi:hypothetical protein
MRSAEPTPARGDDHPQASRWICDRPPTRKVSSDVPPSLESGLDVAVAGGTAVAGSSLVRFLFLAIASSGCASSPH